MAELNEEKQNGQKTIVAFIVGLLIGGLLVWVFAGSNGTDVDVTEEENGTTTEELDSDLEDDEDVLDENEDAVDVDEDVDVSENDLGATFGNGEVEVLDQAADSNVELASVTFPTDEGWIGVRSINNDQKGALYGVARFSREQGLIPESIETVEPLRAGQEYGIVFFSESGDREFSTRNDIENERIYTTFIAQ